MDLVLIRIVGIAAGYYYSSPMYGQQVFLSAFDRPALIQVAWPIVPNNKNNNTTCNDGNFLRTCNGN